MIITLKNDENIKLEWSYLVLEYLEEREGTLNSLEKRMKNIKGLEQVKLVNNFIYAIIQANIDEIYTYKQTIRLVKPDDYEKIFKWIEKQMESQASYKKKEPLKKSGNQPVKKKKASTGQKSSTLEAK